MASRHNMVKVTSPAHTRHLNGGVNGANIENGEDRKTTVAAQSGGNLPPVDLMMVAMGVKPAPPQVAPLENYLANKKMRAQNRKR